MKKSLFVYGITIPLLASCGGGGSSGSDDPASLSLNITDAPVDEALEVVVEFTGVSVKPRDSEAIVFDFDTPRSIDLLALQGNASEPLLTDVEIPSDNYDWIRLAVTAELDQVLDSYITLTNGISHELWVPSGDQTGLKLNSGFTALAGSQYDFTIDFDLRKSVADPVGQAGLILRPSLRLVDNTEAGTLNGSIDANLLSEACANTTENDGAVYLFTGDVEPVDMQGTDSDPLTTGLVANDWTYEIGFIPMGEYTAAFTCDNDIDTQDAEETLEFHGTSSVTIEADQTTTLDFLPVAASLQ